MEAEKITLMHWNIRGFTEPIKMLLEYLHISYKEVKFELDEMKPAECSSEQWMSIKESLGLEFPTLPNIKDSEHQISLCFTIAICKYLAQKYKPKMIGSAMNECAEIDSILFMCHDMRNSIIEAHESGWEKNKEETMKNIKEKLGYVNKFMRARIWLSGKQVSIADFVFCELMELVQSLDDTTIDSFPNCRKLLRKFYGIAEIAKYKASQPGFDIAKYLKLPFLYEH